MVRLFRQSALVGAWLGCAVVPAVAWGQGTAPPGAVVQGVVLDAARQPVIGATVRLLHLPDTATVAGTQADATGHYEFRSVAAGRYEIRASAVGLRPVASGPLVLDPGREMLTLPPLLLRPDARQLQEVTVLGEQKAVSAEPGKLVYNLDQRTSAAGTSAFEVLQRTPGVSVTQDGDLLLKGSPNVVVLLDGKPTNLNGNQLTALLRGTPAETLARVEVIGTPGAQYDASGSAGLLNLVTKKSRRPGYALDLSAGAGTGRYPQTTETVAGNVKTRQLNLFGNYSYHYKKSYLNRTSYRVLGEGAARTTYDRASFDPDEEHGHSYRAGVDIDLNARHTLGAVYSGYANLWTRTGRGPTTVRHEATGQTQVVQNENLTREPGQNHALNLNYLAKLDTASRQFTANADYARYRSDSRGRLGNQLLAPGQPYQELAFEQPSVVTIRSGQADVAWPVAGTRLAAGAKYSWVTSDNDFRYDSLTGGGRYVYSPVLSNHFVYEERILAAYATAGRTLGATTLEAGLRLENTRAVGTLLGRDVQNRRAYTNLFPSLTVSRKLAERHQLSLALGRRINRPQYSDLNPARYFFDKYSYHAGNPFLQPETAWQGSATYTYRDDYVLTLSAGRTSQAISGFASQNPATGELVVSIANFAYRDDFDAQLIVPLKLAPFWTVQNTLAVRYVRANLSRGPIAFRPGKANVDLTTTHTLKLPGDLRLELAAYYTSPSLAGIYVFRTYFSVDAGLKKSFLARKLDVRLSGTDLFNTIHYWGYSIYEGANTRYNHTGDNRRVNLSLAYHLGGALRSAPVRQLEEAGRVK